MKDLAKNDGFVSLDLESGGGYTLGGPDVTRVTLVTDSRNTVKEAFFSHSNVQVTCEGRLSLI